MPRPQALMRWFRAWRQVKLIAPIDRHDVLEHVDEGGELGPRYAFMTLLSAGIAMLGLLQGSGAVIIGAMLISPLMGPIVEMGMSLATFDFRTLRAALRTMAVGVALAVLISYVIVAVSPLQEPTPEILARTQPTLFDLLVAIFSGLAGAYATVTRKGETIVGVAIATALMPPLAVAGYGLAVGNMSVAGGAAFLFMTNLLAIALSVTIMARWYGFGRGDTPSQTAWQAALIVGIFVLLTIPLGLALRTIATRALDDRVVRTTLEDAAREQGGRITTLRVTHDNDRISIDAVLLTPRFRSRLEQQLERTLGRALKQSVSVDLREVLTANEASVARQQSTLTELRDSVAQLQGAAAKNQAQRVAQNREQAALDARAIGALGTIERSQNAQGARLTWRLRGDAGLDLAASRRLEQRASRASETPLRVVPAVQPLPLVGFADDSTTLDTTAVARLQDIAWALQRWQTASVRITGYGGDDALARARAQAVSDWLGEHRIATSRLDTASRDAARALMQRHGRDAIRSAQLEAGAGMP